MPNKESKGAKRNWLLTDREWQIEGNWYAPMQFLKRFKSVIRVELTDTTSSAGDWSGHLVQRSGNRCHFIMFSQVNNWPRSNGFTLTTDEKDINFDYNKEFFVKDCESIYEDLINLYNI